MGRWIYREINGQMDKLIDRWMDRQMEGQMKGGLDGWKNKWMDIQIIVIMDMIAI